MERDGVNLYYGMDMLNFNSHAHVERDQEEYVVKLSEVDFNSHAHVERDPVLIEGESGSGISTHTLTWSVTNDYLNVKS